jgi:hypothetical protein
MPLAKAALPLSDRELLASLFQAVVRAARPFVGSWDDLKTLLMNGAASAVQEAAARAGQPLAAEAERLGVDVTTLRRNLPPAPNADSVESQLAREIYLLLGREGRATMSEIEGLLEGSAAVAMARRSKPRVVPGDVVFRLVDEGYLTRIEREKLPTQYRLADDGKVLQQLGQSREDWLGGIGYALTLAVETAIRQSHAVNSEAFGRKLRRAQVGAEPYPVPEQERMPWFFVRRPSHMTEHDVNERMTAAIRGVIESLERERTGGDEGALVLLALALNHARTEVGP